MKIGRRPTCEILSPSASSRDGAAVAHVSASIWLSVDLAAWGERRDGHLHFARRLDGREWSPADMSGHPMRPVTDRRTPIDTAPIVEELESLLAARPPTFYRIPELGVVSDLGEGREDFRRRVLGALRPVFQQRIDALERAPGSRLPWRRRRRDEVRRRTRNELAARLASLANSIESHTCRHPWDTVRRIEIGILLVPDGLDLTPGPPRDPMIE